jgi:hypothetical protein
VVHPLGEVHAHRRIVVVVEGAAGQRRLPLPRPPFDLRARFPNEALEICLSPHSFFVEPTRSLSVHWSRWAIRRLKKAVWRTRPRPSVWAVPSLGHFSDHRALTAGQKAHPMICLRDAFSRLPSQWWHWCLLCAPSSTVHLRVSGRTYAQGCEPPSSQGPLSPTGTR